jgi:hypothetical protein
MTWQPCGARARPENARLFFGLLTKQKLNLQPKDQYEQSKEENGGEHHLV